MTRIIYIYIYILKDFVTENILSLRGNFYNLNKKFYNEILHEMHNVYLRTNLTVF